jgi:DNA-binding NarL/FixJ family response regulator
MPDQPLLRMVPSGSRAARGTVHSIESARGRLRRRAPTSGIRVLVVGSHAISRAGLRRLLEDDGGVVVVGEAASGRDGARLASMTDPQVVLVDARRAQPDPAASTRLLAAGAAVLLLTESDLDHRLLAAIRAGATGVLAKDSHPADLWSAVRTLAAGGALLPPGTTRRLITELVNTAPR